MEMMTPMAAFAVIGEPNAATAATIVKPRRRALPTEWETAPTLESTMNDAALYLRRVGRACVYMRASLMGGEATGRDGAVRRPRALMPRCAARDAQHKAGHVRQDEIVGRRKRKRISDVAHGVGVGAVQVVGDDGGQCDRAVEVRVVKRNQRW